MQHPLFTALLTSTLLLSIPLISQAEIDKPRINTNVLERLDTNKDGQISLQEAQEARIKLFKQLDSDKNNSLSLVEIQARNVNMRKIQLERRFKRSDTDNSGTLSLTELQNSVAQLAERRGKITPEQAKEMATNLFKKADVNNDNFLNMEEFSNTITAQRQQRQQNNFMKLDTDKNGEVSYTEFMSQIPLFELLDSNRDGVVSAEEMKKQRINEKANIEEKTVE